ncbi:MAG: general secretion pathway protein GspD [Flavobacteriales bacterium]|nr:MAG: general secretion pathway protein GspD [Flavobacteriales bacterium]
MKKIIKITGVILCLFLTVNIAAQDRIKQIETQLKSMTTDVPGLEENVQMSVSGVSIQEFMRGIADAHKLNISVDPTIQQSIVNNFANATVSDVLLFVCKEYNLKINFIGTIMSIVKFEVPKPIVVKAPKKELIIKYNKAKDELTLDLKNDSLDAVVKAITQKSKKNVVLASGVTTKKVSVYIESMPFDNALEKLGIANNLIITKTEDDSYLVENSETIVNIKSSKGGRNNPRKNNRNSNNKNNNADGGDLIYEAKSFSDISVSGTDLAIDEVIKTIAEEIGVDYYFVSEVKDKATVNVKSTTFKNLLSNMFQGTDLTYDVDNGIYIIGERKTEGLRMTKVIQLQYRSVETVNEYIPSDIKQDVDVKEFLDLNSLILSGSEPRIQEIEHFIKTIDKVVPVVLIEVMIVDYSNSRANSLGIEAGLGTEPAVTSGTVYPEANLSLNSNSINNLIESFNGYGILNLGKVTPNFYLNISAMETQGILRVKSTPKLATLNGHEATMTIGNTEYYVEEKNTVTSNTSTTSQSSRTYKSVTADLSVTIKPIVSGDNQITMEISVSQSDFTAKIEPGAPPGQVSRDFTSVIRVKDQEMILLGGLEEKSIRESGRGVPFLSRIPIIKWFFSSRSREKSKTKLNIFIKPTVIY